MQFSMAPRKYGEMPQKFMALLYVSYSAHSIYLRSCIVFYIIKAIAVLKYIIAIKHHNKKQSIPLESLLKPSAYKLVSRHFYMLAISRLNWH